MPSNFKVFSESGTNICNDIEWSTDSERDTGFVKNTVASSKSVNTALKSATLVTAAIMQAVSVAQTEQVGLESTVSEVPSYIQNGFTKLFSSKSTTLSVTLNASGWTGTNAPFSYVINNSAFTATNNIELVMPGNVTQQHVEAYQSAMILNGTQSSGSITLKAWGDKPTINLPLSIIVRGDL